MVCSDNKYEIRLLSGQEHSYLKRKPAAVSQPIRAQYSVRWSTADQSELSILAQIQWLLGQQEAGRDIR